MQFRALLTAYEIIQLLPAETFSAGAYTDIIGQAVERVYYGFTEIC